MQLLCLHQLLMGLHGLVQELFGLRVPVQPIGQTIESHAFGLLDSFGRCGHGLPVHSGRVHRVLKHGLLLLLKFLLLDEQAGCEDHSRRSFDLKRCLMLLHRGAAQSRERFGQTAILCSCPVGAGRSLGGRSRWKLE